MRRGECQKGVGTDAVAEAQLSGTLCAEEIEGAKDSPINPLGVQPNHGWDSSHPLRAPTPVLHTESAALPLCPPRM